MGSLKINLHWFRYWLGSNCATSQYSNQSWSSSVMQCGISGPQCVQQSSWWRHQMETFSAYWPFVWGIHRSTVNSPHKGQWRGNLMFSLICAWINGWVNNREAGDSCSLWRHRARYDVTVMISNTCRTEFTLGNMKQIHHMAKNMEYLKSTMETLVFEILIYWEWLATNHK